jgi:Tol biopolymer transport system component
LISYVTHEEAGRSILHLQKIDGTSHVRYTDFPGEIGKCLWSPDSTYVVFTGTQKAIEQIDTDLWALRVQGSKFVGEPLLVVPGVEKMRLLSWSQNGQLAYLTSYDFGGLFTLPVDLQTGKATGAPRRLTRLCNFNCRCWSPDGGKIAWCTFYSEKGELAEGINIISAVSGEKIRHLSLAGYEKTGGGMSWSPDGKFIAHAGMDKDKRSGVCLITVETGDIRLLVLPQGEGGGAEEVVGNITWSADSKCIAYGCNGDVYVVNLEDGKPRRLTSPTEKDEGKRTQFFIRPAFAPDGGSVAYMVVNCQKSDVAASSYQLIQCSDTLLATTIDGKETREIFHLKNGKMLVFNWSPDGRHIVFTSPDSKEIWCAATDGAEPFRIADISNLGEAASAWWPNWSPKGDVISFIVSISKNQYWVMENFLPEE